MKKNLISVIILALVIANFVLTALLVFTILPETKKANQLIESVCSAIDLDLNSGAASGLSNVPIDQVDDFPLNGGKTMTISFKTDDNGTAHYLVAAISLSLNKESDVYKDKNFDITTKENLIKAEVNTIVGQYTMDAFNADKQAVYDEILSSLQDMLGADYIVGVNFTSSLTQ